ncbi:MAG: oligosaccharide flippase family protein [Ruminococcus sp.]|nr:oligosaccharide flippase family protein [Ruminococcus sp.]
MKKQNFLKGSLILMASAVLAKLLGALFKIPLTNILGGVGMSYFSCAYSLFMPIYALTVTGLSAAVARMTAQSAALGMYENAKRVRRTALALFSVAGLAGSALILLLAKPFCIYAVDCPEAAAAVAMIAPSVFFGCITSVERGYYEGLSNMYPTALSQLAEGLVKVAAGLSLCSFVTETQKL